MLTTSTTGTTSPTTTSRPSTSTSTSSTTSSTLGPPIANAGPDQLAQTLTALAFDGSRSSDPGGPITGWAWAFGDGGTAAGAAVGHAYAAPGTYVVTLTVTDGRGLAATDAATVTIVNRPPVADAGPDRTGLVASPVAFTGTGRDADGTVLAYRWDFGDGTTASVAAASHAYAAPGTYTATLTVTDDRGARGDDTAVVSVTAAPWARRVGGTGADVVSGIAVDAAGGFAVAGRLDQGGDLGGTSCPPVSLFVARYSAAPALQWARCFVAAGQARAVALDAAGDVVVTGSYGGTVDFGAGPVFSGGARAIFVAKYGPTGTPLWSRVFKNAGYSVLPAGNGIAVDAAGNVVVTGAFVQTVDFGGGAMTSAGNSDVFIAKLAGADGAHVWSRHVSGSPYWTDAGRGVAVDASGNVVVTGTFGGTADFGTGAVTAGGLAVFIAKYSAAGVPLWTRAAGGHLDDAGNAVAVDAAGDVIVTGQVANGTDLGTGWLLGGGDDNAFVAKYTPGGTPLWATMFGTSGPDAGNAVAVDGAGNVVVAGQFGVTIDFGTGALASRGSTDAFLATLSAAGTPVSSTSFGGTRRDAGMAVGLDATGAALVVGQFSDTIDVGGTTLVSAGGTDAVVARVGR
jgi:PKD repeat protein